MRDLRQRAALQQCLSVMLRMIPEACADHGLRAPTTAEHDAAIKQASLALHGSDRRRWAPGARKAAAGGYP